MVNNCSLKTVRFVDTKQWNVKHFFATSIISKYSTESIGKHTIHITEKTKLFNEPEKEHKILGISNEKGMFDAYAELEKKMEEKGVGKIASIQGRFYAMDRDKRWERVQKAYDALVNGIGEKATSATIAIEDSYQKEIFDEFVVPTVICNGDDTPIASSTISDTSRLPFAVLSFASVLSSVAESLSSAFFSDFANVKVVSSLFAASTVVVPVILLIPSKLPAANPPASTAHRLSVRPFFAIFLILSFLLSLFIIIKSLPGSMSIS